MSGSELFTKSLMDFNQNIDAGGLDDPEPASAKDRPSVYRQWQGRIPPLPGTPQQQKREQYNTEAIGAHLGRKPDWWTTLTNNTRNSARREYLQYLPRGKTLVSSCPMICFDIMREVRSMLDDKRNHARFFGGQVESRGPSPS